jgi:hypothetical protein
LDTAHGDDAARADSSEPGNYLAISPSPLWPVDAVNVLEAAQDHLVAVRAGQVGPAGR